MERTKPPELDSLEKRVEFFETHDTGARVRIVDLTTHVLHDGYRNLIFVRLVAQKKKDMDAYQPAIRSPAFARR